MKTGETITIRRVGNGFIVEPESHRDRVYPPDEVLVFNDLGHALPEHSVVESSSLTVFIAEHFAPVKGPSDA